MLERKFTSFMKKTILSKCFLHSVLLTLAFCLFPALPALAQEDIVDRLDKALGVTLPSEYKSKVKEFVVNDTIMRTKTATQFTELFLKEQMKKDWGISKEHQYLFMWSAINGMITKKGGIYNFLDDDDEARSDDYWNNLNTINAFCENYKKGFKAYCEEKSAEYDRQSAEARQQSAEARQQSAEYDRQSAEYRRQSAEYRRQSAEYRRQSAEYDRRTAEAVKVIIKQDSIWVREKMVEFYNIYIQNPNIIKQEDISRAKEDTRIFIADCKKYNIDYRSILLKELGDKKKVER